MASHLPGNLLVKTIVWANGILFAISLLFSGRQIGMTLNPLFALTPSTDVLIFMGASGTIPIDSYHAWWSLITANWLHGSLLHLIFNMMAIRTVGPYVVTAFGGFRMFAIYTLSGAAGFLASYLGQVPLTIGASSGLCGLIGAFLFYGKSRGGQWGHLVVKQTSGWILSLALLGFILPRINNWGHGGGLLGGILLAWILGYQEKSLENRFHRTISILMALATLGLLLINTGQGAALIFL